MMVDELLTVQQAAERLQVHEETIRRWIKSGRLRARYLGSTRAGWRIRPDDLEQAIEQSTAEHEDGQP